MLVVDGVETDVSPLPVTMAPGAPALLFFYWLVLDLLLFLLFCEVERFVATMGS